MLLIALLQAVAAPAPAAPPPPRPAQLFIAPSGEPFRAARDEPYPVAIWFARADADHDGRLTRGEFRRDFTGFFATLDLNGDGVIDGKEIEHYEQTLVPEVQVNFGSGPEFRVLSANAGSGAPVGGGGEGDEASAASKARENRRQEALPRGGGRYALINIPEPVVSIDADLSRRISMAEFTAAADRRFGLLDPDERGYLTLDTLPRTPIQARGAGLLKKKR